MHPSAWCVFAEALWCVKAGTGTLLAPESAVPLEHTTKVVPFCSARRSSSKLRLCGSSHAARASRRAPKHSAVKCIAAELEIGCY